MQIPATQINAAGGAMVQLYDNTAAGAIASWDVTGISQAYNHLRFILQGRSDAASIIQSTFIRMNNDSAANYDRQYLSGSGGSPAAASIFAQTSGLIGDLSAANSPAGLASIVDGTIPNYTGTTFHKQVISSGGVRWDTATAEILLYFANWRSTAAINRLTFTPDAGNFVTGSRLTIYGLL